MLRKFLKAKIHNAVITESNLNYVGSITIDEELMERVGLLEGEVVNIYNISNGERFETYIIKGERGSKVIGINGAAARKVAVGDRIIIVSYAYFSADEINNKGIKPKIIILNEKNDILQELG